MGARGALVALGVLLAAAWLDGKDDNSPSSSSPDPEVEGYVVYCPCMGRFGNQAEHLLGALAFAAGVGRTLVLPHWVEYRAGAARSVQVPFETYIDVDALRAHQPVITMGEFMERVAPTAWPPEERVAYCYAPRTPAPGSDSSVTVEPASCHAKSGNPFGPFWDTFGVEFVGSEFYAPLNYDVARAGREWRERYPNGARRVLAFAGAPASFPAQPENVALHRHVRLSESLLRRAEAYIEDNLKGGYVGIHLRNGPDWARACQHVSQTPNLFSSPQCVGYRNEFGPVTAAMCMPSKRQIIKQLKKLLESMADVKDVFVASDADHMIADLKVAFAKRSVSIRRLDVDDPHLDLAILSLSNHFIGNCVSSFSAFVKRDRDTNGFPTTFWAFSADKSRSPKSVHEEL